MSKKMQPKLRWAAIRNSDDSVMWYSVSAHYNLAKWAAENAGAKDFRVTLIRVEEEESI